MLSWPAASSPLQSKGANRMIWSPRQHNVWKVWFVPRVNNCHFCGILASPLFHKASHSSTNLKTRQIQVTQRGMCDIFTIFSTNITRLINLCWPGLTSVPANTHVKKSSMATLMLLRSHLKVASFGDYAQLLLINIKSNFDQTWGTPWIPCVIGRITFTNFVQSLV